MSDGTTQVGPYIGNNLPVFSCQANEAPVGYDTWSFNRVAALDWRCKAVNKLDDPSVASNATPYQMMDNVIKWGEQGNIYSGGPRECDVGDVIVGAYGMCENWQNQQIPSGVPVPSPQWFAKNGFSAIGFLCQDPAGKKKPYPLKMKGVPIVEGNTKGCSAWRKGDGSPFPNFTCPPGKVLASVTNKETGGKNAWICTTLGQIPNPPPPPPPIPPYGGISWYIWAGIAAVFIVLIGIIWFMSRGSGGGSSANIIRIEE